MPGTAKKMQQLQNILTRCEGAVIAFSGGVDSTFLAGAARAALPGRLLAVTAASPIHPEHETRAAAELARQLGIAHLVIHTEELADKMFTANSPQRCYYCKKALFNRLLQLAQQHGLPCVLEGTNADDRFDHRPGAQAAAECGIKSPLLDAELTKEEIRTLSKEMGLPTWNKPARPCLASRFPYGEVITAQKLSMVENAEAYLQARGLESLRVRHHGNLARIEVEPRAFPLLLEAAAEITARLKQIGYTYVTLDLQGFRSGSLNEGLSPPLPRK